MILCYFVFPCQAKGAEGGFFVQCFMLMEQRCIGEGDSYDVIFRREELGLLLKRVICCMLA